MDRNFSARAIRPPGPSLVDERLDGHIAATSRRISSADVWIDQFDGAAAVIASLHFG
jgi:hypothetical protein